MDLTMLGVGFIVGHLAVRASRKDDKYKVNDTITTAIGLLLILGGRFHLFGG